MLRLGIVGAGTMGATCARDLAGGRLGESMKLAGICDTDVTRAVTLAGELDVPGFGSADELLDAEHLDAVYVATPDDAHRAPFEAALRAGVAVLVEKPFATTVTDALAMRAAAERSPAVTAVNFSNRWNPPFRRAKAAVQAGEIGDVLAFNCSLSNCIRSPTRSLSWAGRSSPGWFLLSHCFDLARWYGGRRASTVLANGVRQRLRAAGVDTYDFIHAMVRYDDGSDGLFESSWVTPDVLPAGVSFRFEITGSEGTIAVDTTRQMITVASARSGYQFPPTLRWSADRLADFAARIRASDLSLAEADDGVANTRLLTALHRSLESGMTEDTGE